MENNFYIGQKVQVDVSYGIIDECRIINLDSGHPLYSKSMVKVSGIADPVPIELVSPLKGWVTIDGLYKAAREAYMGVSFDPEKRADGIVYDYENELNNDLKTMPAEEQERYIANYKKHLFAWLAAKSRCYSSMIAGPSNFPARQMEKRNRTENNRLEDFLKWREKALKAIASKIRAAAYDAMSESDKLDARFAQIEKGLQRSVRIIIAIDKGEERGASRALFVSSITGMIKTFAKNGEAALVGRCLEYITEVNERPDLVKPVISKKHSVWKLLDKAVANVKKQEERQNMDNNEEVINGVKVVRNYTANRLQLFFDGKPASETITKLKKAAFKWTPSQGCWQRQLTQNAVYAMQQLLK